MGRRTVRKAHPDGVDFELEGPIWYRRSLEHAPQPCVLKWCAAMR